MIHDWNVNNFSDAYLIVVARHLLNVYLSAKHVFLGHEVEHTSNAAAVKRLDVTVRTWVVTKGNLMVWEPAEEELR